MVRMWRSVLEIWIAWLVVALVADGFLYTTAAKTRGRIDERTINPIQKRETQGDV